MNAVESWPSPPDATSADLIALEAIHKAAAAWWGATARARSWRPLPLVGWPLSGREEEVKEAEASPDRFGARAWELADYHAATARAYGREARLRGAGIVAHVAGCVPLRGGLD